MIRIFLVCFLLISGHASAALYQCKNSDGEVEFMDMPCPKSSNETTLAKDLDDRGFFKKYFLPPSTNKLKPNCTERICYCGSRKINLKHNAELQLIESARRIPWLWSNFNSSYSRYKRSKASGYGGNLSSVQEVACELALHQALFDKYFDLYQARLKQTQSKKNKVTGQAVECGDAPYIKADESMREFRHRHGYYKACLKKKGRNHGYKYSQSRYKDSQKTLNKMESALAKLRQMP